MIGIGNLIRRNCKLFFNDKGMFFTSLVTPMILLVLYATFLSNVYKDSFNSQLMSFGIEVSDELMSATVGGQLVSALLAVCCVTVSFSSNFLSVQDRVRGASRDIALTPVKSSTVAIGYYISTLISTLIICVITAGIGFCYLALVGWYLSVADILKILLDVFLLSMFGTALSSIITSFMTTEGQISAASTIVSAGYGFICGAYMPISGFSAWLRRIIYCLPGTYGTSLIKNHTLHGVFSEMSSIGFPDEAISGLKVGLDCKIDFYGHDVTEPQMYAVMVVTVGALVLGYIILNAVRRVKK